MIYGRRPSSPDPSFFPKKQNEGPSICNTDAQQLSCRGACADTEANFEQEYCRGCADDATEGDNTLRSANVILAGLRAQPACHGDIGDELS